MANETTLSTVAEFRLASVIDMLSFAMMEEARPSMVMSQFVKQYDISSQPSNVLDIPILNDTGAASSLAEVTAASNTAVDPTEVSITVAKYVQNYDIYDEVLASQVWSPVNIGAFTDGVIPAEVVGKLMPYAQLGGRALMEAIETQLTALLGAHTTTVGSLGVNLSHTNFITAMYELDANDAKGKKIAILHPIQVSDLRVALGVATTTTSPLVVKQAENFINDNPIYGFAGNLLGVDVYQSTLVPEIHTAADRAGGMFIDQLTYAIAFKWFPKLELSRTPKSFLSSLTSSVSFGVVEVRDGHGVSILTDHE